MIEPLANADGFFIVMRLSERQIIFRNKLSSTIKKSFTTLQFITTTYYMKKLLLAFISLALSFQLSAQTPLFEWVETQPVDWNLNPAMVRHSVTVDGIGNSVAARMLGVTQYFGDLYGNYAIEVRDPQNNLQVSYPLSGKVIVQSIAADATGNMYVGGKFLSTLHLGIDDSLVNQGNVADTFNVNTFLIKINANGFLVWKRNMESTHPGLQNIDDIRVDPMQHPWFAYSEWMTGGHIQQLDGSNGNDVMLPLTITGVNGVTSFDFDPQGNIFLAGSASSGTVTIGSQTYNLSDSYNMYIARFDNQGNASWAKFAHDVTFQMPQVKTDLFGNAFVGGFLMDSLTWGTIHLLEPQWINDFWLVKVTGNGDFAWGQQAPQSATLTGDIGPADGMFIATDSLGDAYFLGNLRGSVTWSNGEVSDAGPLPSSAILLTKFNGFDGLPAWTLTTGIGTTYAHELAADKNKNLYFTQTVTDTTSYGFFSVEIPQYQNTFLIAKLTYLQDTTINVSINDFTTKAFDIYPNPATTSIIVPQELQGSDLSVVDVTGKEVAYHQGVGPKVNVQSLPSGCYFLQFRNERIRFIGKLVKE